MKQRPILALLGFAGLGLLVVPGCHFGMGPQLGYTAGSDQSGMSYGWEVSGGYAYLRGAAGQVIRSTPGDPFDLEPDPDDPVVVATGSESLYYGVVEPGVLLGLTLGYAWGQGSGHGASLGLWGGLAWPDVWKPDLNICPSPGGDCGLTASLAFGLRYLNEGWEAYLTPKAVFVDLHGVFGEGHDAPPPPQDQALRLR